MVSAASLWTVFGTSIPPIIELKGAIPLGLGLGVPFWTTYFLALLGSCLPAPFIVIFIERIIRWMQGSKVKLFNKFANWLMGKVKSTRGGGIENTDISACLSCGDSIAWNRRVDRLVDCKRAGPEARKGNPAGNPWERGCRFYYAYAIEHLFPGHGAMVSLDGNQYAGSL